MMLIICLAARTDATRHVSAREKIRECVKVTEEGLRMRNTNFLRHIQTDM